MKHIEMRGDFLPQRSVKETERREVAQDRSACHSQRKICIKKKGDKRQRFIRKDEEDNRTHVYTHTQIHTGRDTASIITFDSLDQRITKSSEGLVTFAAHKIQYQTI